jgi:hypothetical protein
MVLTTSWQVVDSYVWTHSSGAKMTFYLEAKYTTQDKTNNKTTVNTRLRSVMNVGSASGSGYSYTCSYAEPRSGSAIWYFATETILTGSSTIAHNSDGTKSLTLTATVANSYLKLNETLTGTVDLPQIPRASAVSCSSPYIGDVAIITIDKKATNFTSTVTYKIGELTGTIADKTSETTLSFNTSSLKNEIYALIPDSKKTSGTITCITYSGNTQIGEAATTTFNLYAVEDDCKPNVSATIVDTNEATLAFGKLVKYISKPKVTITATAKNSATIKGYSINLNDGQTSTLQEATFESIGSNSITIGATDSRDYSNSQTLSLEMVDYIKLHIDTIEISRTEDVSNEAILNAKGVWFNGNFNDETTNTLTARLQYKTDGTEWQDGGTIAPTITGNTFTFTNVSLGNVYDYNNEYQFKIILSDSLMTVGSENKEAITLSKGQETIAIGEDGVWVYGDLLLNDANIIDTINEKVNPKNDKIAAPTMYTFTRVTGNIPLNAWSTLCEDLSVELDVGLYLLIFGVGITGSANGLTSFNPVVNGSRTGIQTRNSVPIGSSLQTNAQCIVPLTVTTKQTYKFNMHEYANANNVVSTATLYIYKLN